MSDSELLVTVSVRFPGLDTKAVGALIAPLVETACSLGGVSCSVSVQPYDPDEEDES